MIIEPTSRKPKVCILIDKLGFNYLLQGLEYNAANKYANEKIIDEADFLIEKIKKYSRLYIDNDKEECADVRFFENEAARLILQFIFASSAETLCNDFYGELIKERLKDEEAADKS